MLPLLLLPLLLLLLLLPLHLLHLLHLPFVLLLLLGTDPTGAGGGSGELQVAALGGEKAVARNSGARGYRVPSRQGRGGSLDFPGLAEIL
jgi:hypothetical protein